MIRNNKNGKILNVLLGTIAVFVLIFIIFWIVGRGNNNAKNYEQFKKNLESLQTTAKDYFANELPSKVGDNIVIKLKDLYRLNLTDTLYYERTACSEEESYVSITKLSDNEYKVKSYLVCKDKKESITEKITSNTIVNDKNGNTIVNDKEDGINLDVNKDSVSCYGTLCKFVEIPTTCTTTYTYEFVKRGANCENGYTYKNGACVKEVTETKEPNQQYITDPLVKKVTAAIYTPGGYAPVTTDAIFVPASSHYEYERKQQVEKCPDDTYTIKNGKCYKAVDAEVTDKECKYGWEDRGNGYCYNFLPYDAMYVTECPDNSYTPKGNYCYKYTALTDGYTCPEGWDQTGTGSSAKCTKKAETKYTAWGNPTSTYQTTTKENEYTKDLEKKVLVGTGTTAGITFYTYAIYNRTTYKDCSVGTYNSSDGLCHTSAIKSGESGCPDGYKKTSAGDQCYLRVDGTVQETRYCDEENGYKLTKDESQCYKRTKKGTTTDCPKGSNYNSSTGKCEFISDITYEYGCPAGYTDNGSSSDFCYKIVYDKNGEYQCADPTYHLKSYYVGDGYNYYCYKLEWYDAVYSCEDKTYTLDKSNNTCYKYETEGKKDKYCPDGYKMDGNICKKTTTITKNPTWSNLETIFSKESYLPGYQRTGLAKFVTVCTPIEEIHYK